MTNHPDCPLPLPGDPAWDWGTNERGEFEARGIVGTGVTVKRTEDDWGKVEYVIRLGGKIDRICAAELHSMKSIEASAIRAWNGKQRAKARWESRAK